MQTLQQLKSGELKGSTRLKLSCDLTEFPKEIFDLADTLELLDLSGNALSGLPNDFGRLAKLKIAFFSDNLFTELPEVLSDCPQLEMIGFKSNQISIVSEKSIPNTTRWLILTNNQITQLPKSIGNCSRLQKVAFAGNKLSSLPTEMVNCKNLELLRISANEIKELPKWLLSLPKLSWLAFAGNPCSNHQQVITDLEEHHWDHFEIKEQLGEGASGIISKAVLSHGEKKEIALKVFKGEVTSDGLPKDEMAACIAAGAHHHLVNVIGKISDHPQQKDGLVLELIPATYKNLGMPPSFVTCTRDTFHEGTVFSLETTKQISLGIALASAHLHARGIMHGDLYAHNILVDPRAHSLFGDFGAATIYDRNSDLASSLERLDVRAFGCLLEDLLVRTSRDESNQDKVSTLMQLKDACMNTDILNRPDFETISACIKQL